MLNLQAYVWHLKAGLILPAFTQLFCICMYVYRKTFLYVFFCFPVNLRFLEFNLRRFLRPELKVLSSKKDLLLPDAWGYYDLGINSQLKVFQTIKAVWIGAAKPCEGNFVVINSWRIFFFSQSSTTVKVGRLPCCFPSTGKFISVHLTLRM